MILKADKTSTIVVMDKDDYIKEGLRQLASIHYTEVRYTPDPTELANQLMRTIDDLLEANQIDKTTHRILSQTAKQNSWGKMYLLPKVHKLSPDEITQAETHSLKSLNKTLPGRGGGDNSVVRAPDSWLKGRGFESLLERRENFLLRGRLSVLTLLSVSVPPPCYHSST